jgi:predicted nucleotidyltransferase component of viral defense system
MEYREIVKIANSKNVNKEVIDKDWILSHFLNAMFSFSEISKNFIFKGGTCLRKCYFEDYRFSEDLDFTLLDKSFAIDEKFLNKIIFIAEENSNARYYLKNLKTQIHQNIHQGYEITILFWGAFHRPNQAILPVNRWQTKIKLDISFSEIMLLKPNYKPIFHQYSDADKIINLVPAYPLKEIIAEKLRSLIQRNRPRDIYDLNYLSNIIPEIDYPEIKNLLFQKAANKNITINSIQDFINDNKYRKNKRAWQSSLGYHLAVGDLPDFDSVYKNINSFIANILNS